MEDPVTPMTFEIFDWKSLTRGEEVGVLDNALVISRGVVDDFRLDRRIPWLHLTHGRGRRMFHQEDGWQVRDERRKSLRLREP